MRQSFLCSFLGRGYRSTLNSARTLFHILPLRCIHFSFQTPFRLLTQDGQHRFIRFGEAIEIEESPRKIVLLTRFSKGRCAKRKGRLKKVPTSAPKMAARKEDRALRERSESCESKLFLSASWLLLLFSLNHEIEWKFAGWRHVHSVSQCNSADGLKELRCDTHVTKLDSIACQFR